MQSQVIFESPNYRNPPVIETVLGVQFDRIDGLSNAHLGSFWQSIPQDGWGELSDAVALEPQFERFGSAMWSKAGAQLRLSQDVSSRLQIRNTDRDRMIQVQNGRLHVNWMGKSGRAYPRYTQVREQFSTVLEWFIQFLGNAKFEALRANQWEVTYVNRIPKGTVWNEPADWCFFKPLSRMPSFDGLIEAESFGGEWNFVIPGDRGRLHIQWQHASEAKGEGEFIRLTLTARGALDGDNREQILEGLDVGHRAIVCSFARCMSTDANTYWGLENGENFA